MGLIGKKNIKNAKSASTYYIVYPFGSDYNMLWNSNECIKPINGGSFFIFDKSEMKKIIHKLNSPFTEIHLIVPNYSRKEIENMIKSSKDHRDVLGSKDLLYISKKELIDSL